MQAISHFIVGTIVVLTLTAFLTNISEAQVLLPEPTAQDRSLLESSNSIAQQISAIEWLGPLAPIALSPFFGLACLSGIATYGPEWVQQRSAIFASSSPLNNPALFWSMVVLTIITSLPRLSKVSKPIALAAEKLETYAVVIIVIAMRVFGSSQDGSMEAVTWSAPIYLTAGIASFPTDIALAIASAVNILVINGVKLFCEFMIWLIPVPLVDAIVEASNKTLCVALICLYCWSPLVATILNLVLLTICGFAYFWTQRRIVYYLDLVAGPILIGWLPWRFAGNSDGELVFLTERWNGMPKLTQLRLKGSSTEGWCLTHRRWWHFVQYKLPALQSQVQPGWLAQSISLDDGASRSVSLHQRRLDRNPVARAGASSDGRGLSI